PRPGPEAAVQGWASWPDGGEQKQGARVFSSIPAASQRDATIAWAELLGARPRRPGPHPRPLVTALPSAVLNLRQRPLVGTRPLGRSSRPGSEVALPRARKRWAAGEAEASSPTVRGVARQRTHQSGRRRPRFQWWRPLRI